MGMCETITTEHFPGDPSHYPRKNWEDLIHYCEAHNLQAIISDDTNVNHEICDHLKSNKTLLY